MSMVVGWVWYDLVEWVGFCFWWNCGTGCGGLEHANDSISYNGLGFVSGGVMAMVAVVWTGGEGGDGGAPTMVDQ